MPLIKRTETTTVSRETVETVTCGEHQVSTYTNETTQHTSVEEHLVDEENVMRGHAPVRSRLVGAVIYLGMK